MTEVRVGRVYDPPTPEDGSRVLVDRLWPRGLSKERAQLTEWLREVAPSDQLRRWYGHAEQRRVEFRRRYLVELAAPERARALARLQALAQGAAVTLLTASRDLAASQLTVLQDVLRQSAVPLAPGEEGGDPSCWLGQVCPNCGAIGEARPPTRCRSCGAAIPG